MQTTFIVCFLAFFTLICAICMLPSLEQKAGQVTETLQGKIPNAEKNEKIRELWGHQSRYPSQLDNPSHRFTQIDILERRTKNFHVVIHTCELISAGLAYSWKKQDIKQGERALTIAELYFEILEKKFYQYGKFSTNDSLTDNPWHATNYQSTIPIAKFLATYLLTPNTSKKDCSAKLILSLIDPSLEGLKAIERPSDRVPFLGLWLLAHYQLGSISNAMQHPWYNDILNALKMIKLTTNWMASGLHRDGSYYKSEKMLGFDDLQNWCSEGTQYIYSLTDDLTKLNPIGFWQKITRILFHERIPMLPIGIIHRHKTLQVQVYHGTRWGLAVLPFSGILRYFTPDINFLVRAVRAHLSYYEVTKNVTDTAQYWVQLRQVFSAEDYRQKEISYPSVGFIDIGEASLISIPENSPHNLYADLAESWVIHYRDYGILFQTYRISKLNSAKITEYLVIDVKNNRLTLTIEINNKNDDPTRPADLAKTVLRYYAGKNDDSQQNINIDERAAFRVVYNFTEKTYTVGKEDREDVFKFPMVFGNDDEKLKIHLLKDKRGAVVFDHDKPVIYAPQELIEETETVEITKDMFIDKDITDTTTFTFKEKQNQYCSPLCPEF